ncbi:unnamed protein product [Euphydryas editha]|uniref:Uncharacterized protein n=1 Tax=Euphydryas editha TaxID=104508 RepID=A0AAU9VDG6_EUPED|nr:unnamed protein product [Euphydryas editha]
MGWARVYINSKRTKNNRVNSFTKLSTAVPASPCESDLNIDRQAEWSAVMSSEQTLQNLLCTENSDTGNDETIALSEILPSAPPTSVVGNNGNTENLNLQEAKELKPGCEHNNNAKYFEEYQLLPRRINQPNSSDCFQQLYHAKLPITNVKYNHLQELKCVIPRDLHPFYDNLPH